MYCSCDIDCIIMSNYILSNSCTVDFMYCTVHVVQTIHSLKHIICLSFVFHVFQRMHIQKKDDTSMYLPLVEDGLQCKNIHID